MGGREGVDDLDGGGEADAEAGQGRGVAQGDGQVAFPKPTPPMRMALALSWMNLRRKRFWTEAVDLGRPSEVELLEGLEHGEAGLADAALAGPVLMPGGLALDQAGQEVQVGPLLCRRPGRPGPRSAPA